MLVSIIAGIIIGPYTPPFILVKHPEIIEVLANLGIVLLMFSIGLELSFRKLRAAGKVAISTATLEIPAMTIIGYLVGRLIGWSDIDSIFIGAIISSTSTAIMAKVLLDFDRMKEQYASAIIAINVVQDLLTVAIIVILPAIVITRNVSPSQILQIAFNGIILLGVTITLLKTIIPRIVSYLSKIQIGEVPVLTFLGLCFGMAFLSKYLGFSVAAGAFIAGAILAETNPPAALVRRMEPIRDMFTAVFFVAMGMLIDVNLFRFFIIPAIIFLVVAMVGKGLICGASAYINRYDYKTSVHVGVGMIVIGEFSFVIAKLGSDLGVISPSVFPVTAILSAVTAFLTPTLIKNAPYIAYKLAQLRLKMNL